MNTIHRFFELSLVGMLASGFIAIAGSGYLSLPVLIIAALALILRTVLIFGQIEFQIPPSWVTVATLSFLLFLGADYLWISREFLTVTVHLVIFLAIVKLFTAKNRRDYFYLEIVAFLEILAASMISANTSFFAGLALFLFFAVATFASAEIKRSGASHQVVIRTNKRVNLRLAFLTVSVTLGILVMSSVMFFLLPRTARAAFQHLIPERYHIAGFSNELNLGRIGELKLRQTPVAHIRALDDSGSVPQMLWRGSSLRTFDGHRWINPPIETGEMLRSQGGGLIQLATDDQRRKEGQRAVYEINLQSIASDTIFVAGTPEFLQINTAYVRRMSDEGLKTPSSTPNGIRYVVYSFLDPVRDEVALSTRSRIEHLILPPTNDRVIELARSLGTPLAIEKHLKESYRYSLELPKTIPDDPMVYFLFNRRAGHCEYFASAMAVMLRVINVPSRVVTGFAGGIQNEMSGWHVLRAADAHSWVEAWIDGQGWVTFDPTPSDPDQSGFGMREKWAMWVDALDTFWQDWVLGYTLDQQLNLASRVEHTRFNFDIHHLPLRKIGLGAGVCVFLVVCWIYFPKKWTLKWKQHFEANDAERFYQQLLKILRRKGFERPAWMTPQEFVLQLPATSWKDSVAQFTQSYYDLRFGGRKEAIHEMQALLSELRRSR